MDLYRITEQKLYYFKYSENTIKNYLSCIYEFQNKVNKHYSRITSKDIQSYLDEYKFPSVSKQNQVISALKFAWEKGLRRKYLKVDFKRPRKEKKLPRVIDKNEMSSNIRSIRNLKHKAILWIMYSTGMRRSELINLEIRDIDSSRMLIHIRNAKGKKDRLVPLSLGTLEILREYFKEYKPINYLFNGSGRDKYSATSIYNISKRHLGCNPHIIRHSTFTSMLESGVDLRIIQKCAGHSSSKTSEIYTHVSRNLLSEVATPM